MTGRIVAIDSDHLRTLVQFNGNLATWDVRSVKDFRSMFQDSPFDGDLSGWQMRADAETGFMFGNRPQLLSRESRLVLPVIPLKEDMKGLFGYKSPAYDAWLTERPIDANHWRVLMQVVEASEKESAQWMMVNSSTHAPVAPSLEGMFA